MARAALSVVFSHGRDDEIAALRARVAHLERNREDLCWLDRVQQVEHVCDMSTSCSSGPSSSSAGVYVSMSSRTASGMIRVA